MSKPSRVTILTVAPTCPPLRYRKFADSFVEGDGFELPVPRAMRARLNAKIAGSSCAVRNSRGRNCSFGGRRGVGIGSPITRNRGFAAAHPTPGKAEPAGQKADCAAPELRRSGSDRHGECSAAWRIVRRRSRREVANFHATDAVVLPPTCSPLRNRVKIPPICFCFAMRECFFDSIS